MSLKSMLIRFVSLLSLFLFIGCASLNAKTISPLYIEAKKPEAPPPRVVLMPSSIRITEKIQFAFNSDKIEKVSFNLLEEIADVLIENPQIELIQIEGHTDSQGDPKYNLKLSEKRAKSVRKFLIGKKIKPSRLVAKGFGDTRPIDNRDIESAYELNRRVEFNILKQSDKKVLIPSK